jgi:hypothetical protein
MSICVLILSPPFEHAKHVSTSLALKLAVFVEKPLEIDLKCLECITGAIRQNEGRLYCSDFYLDIRGAALWSLLGDNINHTGWIATSVTSLAAIS